MTTISQRLSFPNQALLFDLEQLYRCLQTVPDRRKRRGWRYPLAALLMFLALAPKFSSGAITRRWLEARLALFRQLPFEFMDPHQCLASLLQRFCYLLSERCILCFKLSDQFLCCHGFIVAASTIPLELFCQPLPVAWALEQIPS